MGFIRYMILKDFRLNGFTYLADSTFVHEDKSVCNILEKSGFILSPPVKKTYNIISPIRPKYKYLGQQSKDELIITAEDEGISIKGTETKEQLRNMINAKRGKIPHNDNIRKGGNKNANRK